MYKIRRSKNSTGHTHYSITVPRTLGEVIPDEMVFAPTVTEEGILFRPLIVTQVEVWAEGTPQLTTGGSDSYL